MAASAMIHFEISYKRTSIFPGIQTVLHKWGNTGYLVMQHCTVHKKDCGNSNCRVLSDLSGQYLFLDPVVAGYFQILPDSTCS